MLWKNHRKTLINLPWKYHESNSTHFCFPIFGWLISSKSENFDAVAIHQFWSKWPQTKPKWLILVCFTTNFAPKRYFFELRCPIIYLYLCRRIFFNLLTKLLSGDSTNRYIWYTVGFVWSWGSNRWDAFSRIFCPLWIKPRQCLGDTLVTNKCLQCFSFPWVKTSRFLSFFASGFKSLR